MGWEEVSKRCDRDIERKVKREEVVSGNERNGTLQMKENEQEKK